MGQIGLGFLGVDLPADIRDIFYDITNFEVSTEHIVQTLMDVFAVLPLIGGLKYTDEGLDVLKSAVKHGDEAADVVKADNNTGITEKATKHGIERLHQHGKIKSKEIGCDKTCHSRICLLLLFSIIRALHQAASLLQSRR